MATAASRNSRAAVEVDIESIDASLCEINDIVRSIHLDEPFFSEMQARLEFIGQTIQDLLTFCASIKGSNIDSSKSTDSDCSAL